MNHSGWGNFPKIKSKFFKFDKLTSLLNILNKNLDFIVCGNARSYGDSALNKNVIVSRNYSYFMKFEKKTGLLKVQSGVLLSDILNTFVPLGWFLAITPGTKFITIGGAIASDVHGKNHHLDGCFSESVKAFNLMLPNGEIIKCSKNVNSEFFKASCGGMGLTGIITDAEIYLKKINSVNINQISIKTKNLKETFDIFEKNSKKEYIVAWIDCLSNKADLGKGIIQLGSFKNDGNLNYEQSKSKKILLNFPAFLINKITIKMFNYFYFNKVREKITEKIVNIESFFYPLDSILNWNKIYGNKGFIQYQFVLPKKESYIGLCEILELLSKARAAPTLAVLKLFGKANENYLSFPMEGYTLAVDFKINNDLFDLLDSIDKILVHYGGRIYLAKDARIKNQIFEKGYPNIEKFRLLRRKHNLNNKFKSLQSLRLKL